MIDCVGIYVELNDCTGAEVFQIHINHAKLISNLALTTCFKLSFPQVWIYRDKTNKRRKSEFKEET